MIDFAPGRMFRGSVPAIRSRPAALAHPYSSRLSSRIARWASKGSAVVNPVSSKPHSTALAITSSLLSMPLSSFCKQEVARSISSKPDCLPLPLANAFRESDPLSPSAASHFTAPYSPARSSTQAGTRFQLSRIRLWISRHSGSWRPSSAQKRGEWFMQTVWQSSCSRMQRTQ